MSAAVPEPTLEGKIAEVLGEHRLVGVSMWETTCACDGWTEGDHMAHLAAVLAPLVVEVRERAVEEALEAAANAMDPSDGRAYGPGWLRARIVRAGGRP